MTRGSRAVYPVRPRLRRPLPRALWLSISVPVAGVLIAGTGWYVFTVPSLQVRTIEIEGAHQTPTAEIEESLREVLNERRWGILPAGHYLVISADRIERMLKERFPALEAVRADPRFPNRLGISITERNLWGIYCQRPDPSLRPKACAYLDRHGTAYEPLAGFSGWLLPVIYGSEPVAAGAVVVPESAVAFYEEARAALAGLGEQLLVLARASSTPEDARLGLAGGWTVVVSAERPVAEWSNVLSTVLAEEVKERRALLEYVDARFGRKVFYKFK